MKIYENAQFSKKAVGDNYRAFPYYLEFSYWRNFDSVKRISFPRIVKVLNGKPIYKAVPRDHVKEWLAEHNAKFVHTRRRIRLYMHDESLAVMFKLYFC